jgi:hypothetical protein
VPGLLLVGAVWVALFRWADAQPPTSTPTLSLVLGTMGLYLGQPFLAGVLVGAWSPVCRRIAALRGGSAGVVVTLATIIAATPASQWSLDLDVPLIFGFVGFIAGAIGGATVGAVRQRVTP